MPSTSAAATMEPRSTTVAKIAMRLSCSISKPCLIVKVFLAYFSDLYPAAIICLHETYRETPMKLALIGASGFVGAAILQEALNRGHQVTGIVRHPEKLPTHAALTAVAGDDYDAAALAQTLAGHDAVIHAFNPGWGQANIRELFIQGSQAIYAAVKQAGVKRMLVVGGAGSLYVAPNLQLLDTPDFPDEYKAGAEGARQALKLIQGETTLDWSFVSPPALLHPGERTGQFRIGGDQLLMKGEAPAGISVADLAVAIIDELERPQHISQRFTVGY